MKRIFLFILPVFLSVAAHAQYTVDDVRSSMTILGSSNLTDWNQTVEEISGEITVERSGHVLSAVSNLELTIPVKGIKSGQQVMDQNTCEAMNAKEHPDIVFQLESSSISGTAILFKGELTIAGKTQQISINTIYSATSSMIIISGDYNLNMTDFGITPPTALMGTMKTNDELELEFSLVFEQ